MQIHFLSQMELIEIAAMGIMLAAVGYISAKKTLQKVRIKARRK